MNSIKLAIERFWMEPGNFEMWCEMLSRIPKETEARSIKAIAKLYLDKDVEGVDKQLDRSKELYGLMGYNYSKSSRDPEIKGANFLERNEGYLRLTQEAVELVEAYHHGGDWEKLLARQLLSYSPRTRVIMHLLINEGVIQTQGYPISELGKWQIVFEGEAYSPFVTNPARNDMNRLLFNFKTSALGPMWMQIIADKGLVLDDNWQFIGSGGPEPAITNLTAFMRCPMQLFDFLEWLIEKPDGTRILNMKKIAGDIAIKQLFTVEHREEQSELDWLKREIEQCADYRGLFPVELVLGRLMAKYYTNWDKGLPRFMDYYLNKGINEGLFLIVGNESGQPRHGRGYLGKREYQLIKLDFSQGGLDE